MNFLVTGGAGFIGSHVCERLLLAGHAVWAFDDLNDFYDPQIKRRNLRDIQSLAKPFEFVHGDLTDAAAVAVLFGRVKFDQVQPVYTFTAGGPILKNRAWFFGAYEYSKNTTPQRQTAGQIPEDYQQTTKNKFPNVRGTVQIADGHQAWVKYFQSPTTGVTPPVGISPSRSKV